MTEQIARTLKQIGAAVRRRRALGMNQKDAIASRGSVGAVRSRRPAPSSSRRLIPFSPARPAFGNRYCARFPPHWLNAPARPSHACADSGVLRAAGATGGSSPRASPFPGSSWVKRPTCGKPRFPGWKPRNPVPSSARSSACSRHSTWNWSSGRGPRPQPTRLRSCSDSAAAHPHPPQCLPEQPSGWWSSGLIGAGRQTAGFCVFRRKIAARRYPCRRPANMNPGTAPAFDRSLIC